MDSKTSCDPAIQNVVSILSHSCNYIIKFKDVKSKR